MLDMTKPILVVTSRYTKEIEDRIDRDYNARRNPEQSPFNQQELITAAEGAEALFITPADRLDSVFSRESRRRQKSSSRTRWVLSISICKQPLAGKFRSPTPLVSTMKSP